MGKQVKDWSPPEDAVESAQDTVAQSEAQWTPPNDAVAGPVKKKESTGPSASSSGSSAPAAPSGESGENIPARDQLKQKVKNLNTAYQYRFQSEFKPILDRHQKDYRDAVTKKRAELQSQVQEKKIDAKQANSQLASFEKTKRAEADKLITSEHKKLSDEFYKENSPDINKWVGIYNEQFIKQDFQENKEQNPLKTFGKTAWSTFSEDLPSAIMAAKALGQSTTNKVDQALIRGAQKVGLKPVSKETASAIDETFDKALKFFGASDEDVKKMESKKGGTREGSHQELIIKDLQESIELSNAGAESKRNLINNLDKVKGGDWLDVVNYVASAAGQGVGQIPASIGTRGATSIVQEMGSIYLDSVQKIAAEEGISVEEVIKQGKDDVVYPLIFGLGAGLLDAYGANKIKGLVSKKDVLNSFRKRALELGEVVGTEAVTEGAQTILEDLGINKAANKTWLATLKDLNPKNIIESSLQGGIAALFLGGVTHATQAGIVGMKDFSISAPELTPDQLTKPTDQVVKEITDKVDPENTESLEKAAEVISAKVEQATNNPVASAPDLVVPDKVMTDNLPTTSEYESEKQNVVQEGAQDASSYNREKKTDIASEVQNRPIEASYAWLDAISGDNMETISNIEKSMLGEPLDSKEQESFILDNINSAREKIRAQSDNGGNFRETSTDEGARSSQRQEQSQQRSKESDASEPSGTHETTSIKSMVEKLFELREVPTDKVFTRVKGTLQELLSTGTEKQKEEIVATIKQKLYALSKSSAETLFQQEPGEAGSPRGERGRVEQQQQGESVADTGIEEKEAEGAVENQQAQETTGEENLQQQEQTQINESDQIQPSTESDAELIQESRPTERSIMESDASQTDNGGGQSQGTGNEPATQETISSEPPGGTTPPSQETTTPSSPEAERRFTNQVLNDPDISDEVKQGLSQEAKTYIPKALSITNKEANAIIDLKGNDVAMEDYLDRTNEIKPDVRATLGENLIRRFNASGEYDKAIKVVDNLAQMYTDMGRAINAAKAFSMLTPDGVLRYITKEISKAKSKYSTRTSDQRKASKDAVDKINQEAVEKILSDPKVRNKIINKTKQSSIKKAIDFLESLKIETKGKALEATYGLTAAAWNTLITVVQKGLQAGLTISQAINKAVAKEKENIKFDEKGARAYLDDKLKDYRVTLDPEKAIKAELKNQNDKIETIIRQHYTVVESKKQSLVEKLVRDANLDPEQAQSISKDLSQEFDRLTREAKEKALKKYLPKPAVAKKKAARQALSDQLIEDSNLGALSDEDYRDAISEKIGVDNLTDEQSRKITDLSRAVQKSKEGFDRNNATERMMNYIAGLKGISWMDVGMSIWYANILSGLSTQVLNISANFAETLGEVYTAAVLNPKETGWIMKGLFSGWGRGLLEALDTVKSGYQPTKFQAKIAESGVLERVKFKGGNWNPYNYLKYVSRIMNAADIFFYQGINEMRAREMAVAMAKKEGRSQPTSAVIKKATDILYKGENPFKDAQDQAAAEGFEGRDQKRRAYEILEAQRPEFVIKDSNDEAARGTFNYEPEGTLGALTSGINHVIDKIDIKGVKPIKFIIPFTRIIANVTNRYLDWTPVGLLRVAKGGIGWSTLSDNLHRKYTPQERAEVLTRAITGVIGMAAIYALTDDDEGIFKITANGTGDTQKNFELQESGWRPYSIKIGDTWYEYKNTPLAIPFATIGFIRDAEKYQGQKDMESKASIVMFGTMKYVMDLSFLQSLSAFMDTFSKENRGGAENFFKKTQKSAESTAKSFVVPNAFTQLSRSIQEVMDMPIKKAQDTGDQIIRDIPILRDNLGNIYDALGDPVVPSQLEKFIPLKPSGTNETEKVWKLIVDNNAWIGKPRRPQKPYGDSLTDEEYDKYSLLAGKITKRNLQSSYRFLSRIKDKELVRDEIDNLKADARREAREILFGF